MSAAAGFLFVSAQAQQLPPGTRFSTYLSGSGVEAAAAVAVDSGGNVYVAGTTGSSDFPSLNQIHEFRGGLLGADAFVAKLDASGNLRYSTFLGGTGDEFSTAVAVDSEGRVFVAGGTTSSDFPATSNALHGFRGGSFAETDGFLVRLSPDGSSIEYATYLGGSGDDVITAIAVTGNGEILLAGTTTSDDFPATPGAFQPDLHPQNDGRPDGFAAKLTPEGEGYRLEFATYLGGSGEDAASHITPRPDGGAWITGFTNSRDFPLANAFQSAFAGPFRDAQGDAFLTLLNETGSAIVYSTYLGGALDDQATGVDVDDDGNVYVTGWTASIDFPATAGAYQDARKGFQDRFVARFTSAGDSWIPQHITYFGSSGFEMGRAGIALDEDGRAWIAGATTSADLPAAGASQLYAGGETDGFVAGLDIDGGSLTFSSLFGGAAADIITDLALGSSTLCVTGNTGSANLPVHNAMQTALNRPPSTGPQATSAFVTCFDLSGTIDAEPVAGLPLDFALHPNYPNPFNPQTIIRFDVKTPSHVRLIVYDVLGRRQATLVSEEYPAGRHEVHFDGRNLASGVYFYVVEMGDFRSAQKMILLR